jgi:hypothetical protein
MSCHNDVVIFVTIEITVQRQPFAFGIPIDSSIRTLSPSSESWKARGRRAPRLYAKTTKDNLTIESYLYDHLITTIKHPSRYRARWTRFEIIPKTARAKTGWVQSISDFAHRSFLLSMEKQLHQNTLFMQAHLTVVILLFPRVTEKEHVIVIVKSYSVWNTAHSFFSGMNVCVIDGLWNSGTP